MKTEKIDWSKVSIGTKVRYRDSLTSSWKDGVFGGAAGLGAVASAVCWYLCYGSGNLDRYIGARVDTKTGAVYLDGEFEAEIVEDEQELQMKTETTQVPNKHPNHDVIMAFLAGEKLEWKVQDKWVDFYEAHGHHPMEANGIQWRVKPKQSRLIKWADECGVGAMPMTHWEFVLKVATEAAQFGRERFDADGVYSREHFDSVVSEWLKGS